MSTRWERSLGHYYFSDSIKIASIFKTYDSKYIVRFKIGLYKFEANSLDKAKLHVEQSFAQWCKNAGLKPC